ncbi:MAG: hypothetical protein ABIH92_02170 [Nanoarchaeota archaeon]
MGIGDVWKYDPLCMLAAELKELRRASGYNIKSMIGAIAELLDVRPNQQVISDIEFNLGARHWGHAKGHERLCAKLNVYVGLLDLLEDERVRLGERLEIFIPDYKFDPDPHGEEVAYLFA